MFEHTAINPWMGLAPFDEADRNVFFGRSVEVRDLFERVERTALTVLFARSGLGKTSLLRAGLIPQLRNAGFTPVFVRFDFGPDDPPLRRQLRRLIASAVASPAIPDSVKLWEWVHDRKSGLLSPVLEGIEPILIFDQFEEIYTLGKYSHIKDSRQTMTLRDEVPALLQELADLAENRPPQKLAERANEETDLWDRYDRKVSPFRVLITLREDYLSQLEAIRAIMPSMMRNRMALTPLQYAQALEAVRKPAPHRISDEEAQAIVRFVAEREHGAIREDQLLVDPAILSLVCQRLAQRHQPNEAIKLGDMQKREQIIAEYYAECFQGKPAALQMVVEDSLLTESGYRETAAKETVESRLKKRGVVDASQELDELRRLRLITEEEHSSGQHRIELTHDLLAPVAKESRDKRHSRENETHQREALEEAQQRSREQRERKRLRRIAWTMGALSAIAIVSAMWGITNARKVAGEYSKVEIARKQEQTALAERRQALEQAASQALPLAETCFEQQKNDDALAHLAAACRYLPDSTLAFEKALYSLNTWQRSQVLSGHSRYLRWSEFSPDGKCVLTASDDSTARMWETKTGRLLCELEGHQRAEKDPAKEEGQPEGIWMARFSPDGNFIVTASEDRTARVWDVRDKTKLPKQLKARLVLRGHTKTLRAAEFSPDGKSIVTAGYDDTARVWNVAAFCDASSPSATLTSP